MSGRPGSGPGSGRPMPAAYVCAVIAGVTERFAGWLEASARCGEGGSPVHGSNFVNRCGQAIDDTRDTEAGVRRRWP